MNDRAEPDEIGGGSDPSPHRRLRTAALVALLLLALGLVGLERWESQRQLDALLTAAADAEQVVHDSRRSLGGLVRYSGGLLARTDLGPEQRAAVLDTFAVDARRFPPRISAPRAALAEVRPLPWDGELADARTAMLARVDAWTGFVQRAQAAPDTLLLERRETRGAREAAAAALVAAADGRSAQRVAELREQLLRR